MYSKDRQASIPNNPTVYRTIRTSIKDNSSRSHESGGPCTPLFGPKTSYFADRQDTNDRHQTQPSPQTSLSNRSRNDRKQDHIVQNFYTKVAQIIIQSRIKHDKSATRTTSQQYLPLADSLTEKDNVPKRINRWFNLITKDIDGLRDELKFWRHQIVKVADRTPSPMIIDIFLDISKLPEDMALMYVNHRGIHRVVNTVGTHGRKIQSVLLESWILQLKNTVPSHTVDLPNLYKKSIVFFRSLQSLVSLLPAFQLRDRLIGSDSGMTLGYRLRKNHVQRFDEIPYETPLSNTSGNESEHFEFADILTPMGTLNLCAHYRKDCSFYTKLVVRDIATLETTVEDWQISRQMRKGYGKIDEPEWPLSSFAPSVNSQRYSSSPTSSVSSSFSNDDGSAATSFSYRRASTPIVSPFKSKLLSSSFGTGSPQMKSAESYPVADPVFHRHFSSSFERYYNNKSGNRDDDDNSSLSGRRESRVSLLSIESYPNNSGTLYTDDDDLSQFMGIVEKKHDLKMFRRSSLKSSSPFEEGEQDVYPESGSIGKSKAALSRFQYMKSSHTSLSESLSSSNTSSRPLSTTQSNTDNNLTASISSMSSFQSREQSLSSSGASHTLGTENKPPAMSRAASDAKRTAYSGTLTKSAVVEEGNVMLPDSYSRNRRTQVSPPLVDRYPFKQPRQPSRQMAHNPLTSANRGHHRLANNNGQYAEHFNHFSPAHEDDDPLIFAMNDMEHN